MPSWAIGPAGASSCGGARAGQALGGLFGQAKMRKDLGDRLLLVTERHKPSLAATAIAGEHVDGEHPGSSVAQGSR